MEMLEEMLVEEEEEDLDDGDGERPKKGLNG